jgi:3-dehydroquinate synthase
LKKVKADNYNIYIGRDVFAKLSELLNSSEFRTIKIFVLVDENTRKHCLPVLRKNIPHLSDMACLEIKSGEEYKTLKTSEYLWKQLISLGAQRNSLLINLGGGVISDIGGFVASAFKRGIRFINIPTTLLSQVDASMGGKTGVDLDNIKNQVGFFSNPSAVFVYPGFLNTLSERELLSGYAEVIKHALIIDAKYWKYLKVKTQKLDFKNIVDWTEIIYKSVLIKNMIVKEDPLELNIRKKLNFGHTIGHAIESLAMNNNKTLLHGEAIAIGIICESYLSYLKTGLPEKELRDITAYILSIYKHNKIDFKDKRQFLDFIRHDKKNEQKSLNFTLISRPGTSLIDRNCSTEEIVSGIKFYNDLINNS